jgi:hypothetical protein
MTLNGGGQTSIVGLFAFDSMGGNKLFPDASVVDTFSTVIHVGVARLASQDPRLEISFPLVVGYVTHGPCIRMAPIMGDMQQERFDVRADSRGTTLQLSGFFRR